MTTSRSNRWAQWALSLAFFFAGLVITFIVINGLTTTSKDLVYEQRVVETQAWVVATMVSEPDETREAFLWRLAANIKAWTDENGAEVCGYLATDGQRWGVKLTTQRSQVMCIADSTQVPPGFQAEDDSIHSHPTTDEHGRLEISKETEQAALAVGDLKLHRLRSGKGSKATLRIRAELGFSRDDFAAGRGYLVANGRLLYQRGRRNVVDLGSIRPEGG